MALRSRHRFIPGLPLQPQFKVTTLYETLADGVRAKALMDSIQFRLGASVQIQSEFWRFDWLREQSLHSTALGAAGNSALVILSVSHATELPPLVQTWIKEWSQQREQGPSALVLLRPRDRRRPVKLQPLCESLRRAALEKGVDFFYESFEPDVASAPADIAASLVPEMRVPSLASPTTRWVQHQLQHSHSLLHPIGTAPRQGTGGLTSFLSNY
jgi:hypothetical protein